MSKANQKFVTSWEQTRKAGRLKYGLTHGLIFGLMTGLLYNLFQLWSRSFAEVFLSKNTIFELLIWVSVGIAGYATLTWEINEYQYNKRK